MPGSVRARSDEHPGRSHPRRETPVPVLPRAWHAAPPFFRPESGPDAAPFREELTTATVGIVGFGTIGREIAARARAFGCRVVGTVGRQTPPACPPELDWLDGRDGLMRLLEVSDFVVLACSLNESTRGLIGAAQLERMKASAALINIARGGVVDEAALYTALTSGTIASAAIDVWWGWPDLGSGQRECAPYDLLAHPVCHRRGSNSGPRGLARRSEKPISRAPHLRSSTRCPT